MDEQEFRRLLDLFPVVRPRNYHVTISPLSLNRILITLLSMLSFLV
jgi:hypothetical protein